MNVVLAENAKTGAALTGRHGLRRCAPQGNADLVTGSSACAAPFSLGRLRRSKITTKDGEPWYHVITDRNWRQVGRVGEQNKFTECR